MFPKPALSAAVENCVGTKSEGRNGPFGITSSPKSKRPAGAGLLPNRMNRISSVHEVCFLAVGVASSCVCTALGLSKRQGPPGATPSDALFCAFDGSSYVFGDNLAVDSIPVLRPRGPPVPGCWRRLITVLLILRRRATSTERSRTRRCPRTDRLQLLRSPSAPLIGSHRGRRRRVALRSPQSFFPDR